MQLCTKVKVKMPSGSSHQRSRTYSTGKDQLLSSRARFLTGAGENKSLKLLASNTECCGIGDLSDVDSYVLISGSQRAIPRERESDVVSF